jgi:hypothetical protein
LTFRHPQKDIRPDMTSATADIAVQMVASITPVKGDL